MEITVTERGDRVSGMYERTFVIAVPVERAWQAFVDPREREKWFVPPGRDPLEHPEQPLIEGFQQSEYKIGEIEEHRRLGWSQSQNVEGDTRWLDTTVVFEEVESGTKITVTRSGFGDSEAWQLFVQSTGLGTDESIADLIAYMETGVPAGRHYSSQSKAPKGSLGAQMRDTAAGVRIAYVVPGGFAEEAGMRAGDLLYRLADASVFRRSDVWCIERVLKPGYTLEAEYVRNGRLLTGSGRLSTTHYTELHDQGRSGA
jgi:uncharacterized protein YndB with AHSA1/START domain